MNRKLRVGVIGGGIGGVALSASLRQRGIEAHLFERASAFREVGAGVQMSPNAVKVLLALGLAEPLRRRGFVSQGVVGHHWRTGRECFRTPLMPACRQAFGTDYYHLHRADLLSMLAGLLDTRYVVLNARCVSVSNRGETAVARFADGREFEADLIVGADGAHSIVRDHVFGPQAPLFTGNMCWRALVPASAHPEFIGPFCDLWQGPRGHVVTYTISGGDALNIVAVGETERWTQTSWHVPSHREELLSAFAGWHPDVIRRLSCAENIFKWGLFDRDPIERWSLGRLTLLGDAAHPMLPFLAQGAAMALEDGYVLARLLAVSAPDLTETLRQYDAERATRTGRVLLAARARGKRLHLPTPWQQFKRDARYKVKSLFHSQMAEQDYRWIYAYDATRFRPSAGPTAAAGMAGPAGARGIGRLLRRAAPLK
ncbi:FAD-dependent monooxygenase [Martelella alba]|uniref:Salicylate 1-monooxygenase n=1 Tax=Martelella alba TaxID=2590451 RepID=A0ABY2SJN9_9HYPH|nr:FAD-dependent monooxygenase [Martelella alba]TKI05112.1 salicylate 1-monooxygenase [Martelella alba]